MQAAPVDEDRRLAVPEVADGAALEREIGVALERYDRREVQSRKLERHPFRLGGANRDRTLAPKPAAENASPGK